MLLKINHVNGVGVKFFLFISVDQIKSQYIFPPFIMCFPDRDFTFSPCQIQYNQYQSGPFLPNSVFLLL